MTSPVVVGEVAVEVTAHAGSEFTKALRRSINAAVKQANLGKALSDGLTKAVKDADLGRALQDALPKRPIRVPVTPVPEGGTPSSRAPRAPRAPRTGRPGQQDTDPTLAAFQQNLRRQIRSLALQAVKIPVTADTARLRSDLQARLAELQRQSRLTVPTEPGARQAYEARLRAMLAAVQRSIPPVQTKLRVDVDRRSMRVATDALSGLASAARGAVGAASALAGIGALVGAGAAGLAGLASAAGAAVQVLAGLAAAAVTASGALLALPGAASIAAAAIGALALGFAGISEAVKQSVDASGAASRSTSGLASAERAYQAALRETRRAQDDLNRARKQAVERIEDLDRALRGAQLDEREAALRLKEAEDELNEAKRTGRRGEIEKLQLAYDQAALAVENARDATGDLAAEQADAARKGVDGADEVVAALDRQLSAADSLASAQERLIAAQGEVNGVTSAAAAAMAKLAPAAQDVVRTILALKPAWEDMQRAVQRSLFASVAGDLQRLSASILPSVRAGLVGVADVLNTQIRAGLAELSTAESRIRLDQIFANAQRALASLTVAVQPLLAALLDVSAVGSQVVADLMPRFGDAVTRVAERLSALAESGELARIITDALVVLRQLGSAAADIGGIIKGIFSAANAAGGSGLLGLLDRLNETVNSLAGQSALTELFVNLGRIGDALMPVLLAVGQALGPISGAIADIAVAFAPSLTQLVLSLGGALASLTPAFIALTPLVDTAASALQPIARIITDLVVAAAPGINAFLNALVVGLQALVPAAEPVGRALGAIFEAVAPLLPVLGQQLANALIVVATAASGIAVKLGPLIEVFGQIASSAAAQLTPVFLQLGQQLLPVMADAGIRIAKAFQPLIPVVAEIARIFAERLAIALPGLVLAFARLLPSVIQIAEALGVAFLQALQAIIPHLPALIDAGLQLVFAFIQLFAAIYPVLPQLLELGLLALDLALNSGLVEHAMRALMIAVTLVAGSIRITTEVVRGITAALGAAKGAAGRMGTAIKDGATSVLNTVKGLPARIASALGDMGRLLYNAGKNVVIGLINGITSMFGALGRTAIDIAGTIRDYLPFSPAKKGPLSGRGNPYYSGQSISQLLADGVRSNLGVVDASADDLASRYLMAADPLAGLSAVTGPTSLPAPAAPMLSWAPNATGDPVLDALRELIRITYGGRVDAALGSA